MGEDGCYCVLADIYIYILYIMVSHKKSRRRGSARQKRLSLTRRNVKSLKVMRGGRRKNGVIENDLYTYTGQYNRLRRPDGE